LKENIPRIRLYIACSLDGFIAREDGSIDWLTKYDNNPETDYGYSEFYSSIGTILMGRKTYEQVLSFGNWPYGDKKSYVFTRQNEPLHREKNVEFVSGNVGEFVRWLKKSTDEDIWLVGGSQLIKTFLEENLVEDLIVLLFPLFLEVGFHFLIGLGKK